ncbi:unnamed protein product [Effrenium voratum]|nr:unnamed protein product [Effrenium voratum]
MLRQEWQDFRLFVKEGASTSVIEPVLHVFHWITGDRPAGDSGADTVDSLTLTHGVRLLEKNFRKLGFVLVPGSLQTHCKERGRIFPHRFFAGFRSNFLSGQLQLLDREQKKPDS